jgi:heme/copper-type cytochrome/quinol oxidase subunit 4
VTLAEQRSGGRGTRFAVVGLALTVLLTTVAFVSRANVSPVGSDAHNRGASQFLANLVFTVLVLAMAAAAVIVVYLFHLKERHRVRDRFAMTNMLISVLVFSAIVIGIVVVLAQFDRRDELGREASQTRTERLGGARRPAEERRRPERPSFNWPAAIGIVALICAAYVTATVRRRRRRVGRADAVSVEDELALLVDETLDDLRSEPDPRKAVIAAYARMERILAAHGLARRRSEAPFEYLARVLLELRVTRPSVERLTQLFALAKFSRHEIPPGLKDQAIEALVSLRDELTDAAAIEQYVPKPAG